MSSWTTGTMPAVVALCKMEIVSMKSGKAPRNLPTRSRAELSPSSFYTLLVKWLRVAFILPENLVRMGLKSSASEILRFSLTCSISLSLGGGSVEATKPSILVKGPFATEFFF